MKLKNKVGAVVVAGSLLVGSAVTAPAASAAPAVSAQSATAAETVPARTKALCNRTQDWTGKDPRTCIGNYEVFDLTSSQHGGKVIFSVQTSDGQAGVRLWQAVQDGYTASQKWCSENSLTCAIVTSVGVAVAGGWLRAAIEG